MVALGAEMCSAGPREPRKVIEQGRGLRVLMSLICHLESCFGAPLP